MKHATVPFRTTRMPTEAHHAICVCVCVCVCVSECVRACVRACVCVCAYARSLYSLGNICQIEAGGHP